MLAINMIDARTLSCSSIALPAGQCTQLDWMLHTDETQAYTRYGSSTLCKRGYRGESLVMHAHAVHDTKTCRSALDGADPMSLEQCAPRHTYALKRMCPALLVPV